MGVVGRRRSGIAGLLGWSRQGFIRGHNLSRLMIRGCSLSTGSIRLHPSNYRSKDVARGSSPNNGLTAPTAPAGGGTVHGSNVVGRVDRRWAAWLTTTTATATS